MEHALTCWTALPVPVLKASQGFSVRWVYTLSFFFFSKLAINRSVLAISAAAAIYAHRQSLPLCVKWNHLFGMPVWCFCYQSMSYWEGLHPEDSSYALQKQSLEWFRFHTSFQTNIDDCVPAPRCENGGVCVDMVNSFSCQCVAGFTGATCQVRDFPLLSVATMRCATRDTMRYATRDAWGGGGGSLWICEPGNKD